MSAPTSPSAASIRCLKSPKADIWSLSVERKIKHDFRRHGRLQRIAFLEHRRQWQFHRKCLLRRRHQRLRRRPDYAREHRCRRGLNPSFGSITYADNDRYANYNGVFFDVKGRFSRGFIDASYTRPVRRMTVWRIQRRIIPQQYYGPSIFDVPNRFSLSLELFAERTERRQRSGWRI